MVHVTVGDVALVVALMPWQCWAHRPRSKEFGKCTCTIFMGMLPAQRAPGGLPLDGAHAFGFADLYLV